MELLKAITTYCIVRLFAKPEAEVGSLGNRPLAHLVLTDRKMANRIIELGIDREWNTSVFSESTIDNLYAELETISEETEEQPCCEQ
jgi:hypothetical protein